MRKATTLKSIKKLVKGLIALKKEGITHIPYITIGIVSGLENSFHLISLFLIRKESPKGIENKTTA
jgi:hypothetical protein